MMMDNTKGIGPQEDTPSVKSGKNYFLGIGINDYTSGLSALYNAVRDVERVGQILKDKYDFDILTILTNAQATRSEILKQLRALQNLSKDDSLIIYYSGHGHLAPEDGYWIPVNADADNIDNYIPNAQLHGLIKAIPTRHTLLIADSCYSGSFFPESETKNMRGAADELEKYRSRWAFCSGRHDQKVSDGTAGTHSPFAEALITELERNNRPKVYIQELAIPVINRTAGKYRQTPKANLIFDCGDDGGQFVFSLKNNEAEEWRLLDKTSVLALEGFVEKYPLSIFGVKANNLIKDLNHEATWQRAKEWHNETSYLTYLRAYPNGIYAEQAKTAMREIADEVRWQKAKRENSVVAFWEYIEAFPNGKYVLEAQKGIYDFELKHQKEKETADRLAQQKRDNEKKAEFNRLERERFEKDEETERKEHEQSIRENLENQTQQKSLTIITDGKSKPNTTFDLFIPLKEFYSKNSLWIKIIILLLIIFLILKDGFDFGFTKMNTSSNPNKHQTQEEKGKSKDPFEGQMITVKGGAFQMGCTKEQGKGCPEDEKPSHKVMLNSFQIGKYEVTQAQWQVIMGNNPSKFKNCDNCTVENVSWENVQQFLLILNKQTGKSYRLPTEAEWEFASRGGTLSQMYIYSGSNTNMDVAWFSNNSDSTTHTVGIKKGNELGLYDMSGNVWEWCNDWFGSYRSEDVNNPKGASQGVNRVGRGGSCFDGAASCRVANRRNDTPLFRDNYLGFRLAMSIQ